MGITSKPERIGVLVLFLWAVIATVFALRPSAPPDAPRAPGGESAEAAALREEVVVLRAEVAELRVVGSEPPPSPPDPDHPAPDSFGRAADALLAEYRKVRDAGKDEARREEIAERLAIYSEVNPEILLAIPVLIREIVDDDEIGDLLDAWDSVSLPAPGSEPDRRLRSELYAILAEETEVLRIGAAAQFLMQGLRPTSRDFGAVLDAARHTGNHQARYAMLEPLTNSGLRKIARHEQTAEFVEHIRVAIERREWTIVTLSRWSTARSDFDLVLDIVRRRPTTYNLVSLQGYTPMSKGREDECRSALAAVVRNRELGRDVRKKAAWCLVSLRPWDEDTATAVREFKDEQGSR